MIRDSLACIMHVLKYPWYEPVGSFVVCTEEMWWASLAKIIENNTPIVWKTIAFSAQRFQPGVCIRWSAWDGKFSSFLPQWQSEPHWCPGTNTDVVPLCLIWVTFLVKLWFLSIYYKILLFCAPSRGTSPSLPLFLHYCIRLDEIMQIKSAALM